MENIVYFVDEITGIEHINIIKHDGSIIGMLKSTYDEMIAAQENAPAFTITTEPPTEQTQEGAE